MNPTHKLFLIALPLAAAGLGFALRHNDAAPAGAAATFPTTGSAPIRDAREADTSSNRRDAQDRLGTYWAPAGSRFDFALDSRIGMAVTAHQGDESKRTEGHELRHAGTLGVTVVARSARELVVTLSCPDLRAVGELAATDDPDRDANLAATRAVTRVRMDCDGRVLGYRFPTDAGATQRNWLRGLYGSIAFVVPNPHGAEWSATGADSTGEFEAGYRMTGEVGGMLSIERRKLRYTAHAAADSMDALPDGNAHAGIDVTDLGWLRVCEVEDHTHVKSTEMPVEFDVVQRVSLELKSTAFDAGLVETVDDDLAWEPAGGQAEDGNRASAERDLRERRAAIEGLTVGTLNQELAALLAESDGSRELYDAWRKACTLLAANDDAVDAVMRLLLDPAIDPKLASLWLSALADAGTPCAQAAVLAAFADQQLPIAVRGAAVNAMFDVRQPGEALLAGLSARVTALTSIDAVDATAVLALGALARVEPSRSDALALHSVEAWEGRARQLGAEDLWLDALTNARSPKVLEAARQALADERVHVRSAALRALGNTPGEDALATLVASSRDDAAPEVRSSAMAQLAMRSEPAAHEALLVAAESDAEPHVREAALSGLARQGVSTADRSRIEAIARNDAEPGLRELASRLLAQR